MFYGNDEDGHIVFGDSIDILPQEYQYLYGDLDLPAFEDFDSFIEDQEPIGTVSGGDIIFENHYDVNYSEPFDYDYLYDLLAAIPSYNLYPNATAVNIFTQVLNGLDGHYAYIITAGSVSGDTYLYYSKDFDVTGSSITLKSPVTQCRYYFYTQSSSTNYTYTVSTLNSDQTFTLSNRLIYTNTYDGYPDVIPYKSKESYSVFVAIALLVAVGFIGIKKIGGKF